MTRDEAHRLLGLSSPLSSSAIEAAYGKKARAIAEQIGLAGTSALQASYERVGERLKAARSVLLAEVPRDPKPEESRPPSRPSTPNGWALPLRHEGDLVTVEPGGTSGDDMEDLVVDPGRVDPDVSSADAAVEEDATADNMPPPATRSVPPLPAASISPAVSPSRPESWGRFEPAPAPSVWQAPVAPEPPIATREGQVRPLATLSLNRPLSLVSFPPLSYDQQKDLPSVRPSRSAVPGAKPGVGPRAAASRQLEAGHILGGRYQLRRSFGEGRAGHLYAAFDRKRSEEVALRILPATIANDPSARRRLGETVRSIASVNHPGIARVYELGRDGEIDFVTMEMIPGSPLARELAGRERRGYRLSTSEALSLGLTLCGALQAAHRRFPHGRLNPSDVWVCPDGSWRISGFVEAAATAGVGAAEAPFLAPEQRRGAPPSAGADQYAVGAILYRALLGEDPPPDPPRRPAGDRPGLAGRIGRTADRAMRPDPNSRFPSMAEVATSLGSRGRVARAAPWVLGGLLVAAAVALSVANLDRLRQLFTEKSANP